MQIFRNLSVTNVHTRNYEEIVTQRGESRGPNAKRGEDENVAPTYYLTIARSVESSPCSALAASVSLCTWRRTCGGRSITSYDRSHPGGRNRWWVHDDGCGGQHRCVRIVDDGLVTRTRAEIVVEILGRGYPRRRSYVTIPSHAVRISRGHLSWVAARSRGGFREEERPELT